MCCSMWWLCFPQLCISVYDACALMFGDDIKLAAPVWLCSQQSSPQYILESCCTKREIPFEQTIVGNKFGRHNRRSHCMHQMIAHQSIWPAMAKKQHWSLCSLLYITAIHTMDTFTKAYTHTGVIASICRVMNHFLLLSSRRTSMAYKWNRIIDQHRHSERRGERVIVVALYISSICCIIPLFPISLRIGACLPSFQINHDNNISKWRVHICIYK